VRLSEFSLARLRAIIVLFVVSTTVSCATAPTPTVVSGTPVSSHSLIADAARKATETPWPEISSRNWGARVIGVVTADEDEFTRGDAIDLYTKKLAATHAPCDDLMRDAIMQIAAAEALYREAKKVSEQSVATSRDIELMETAISTLKESRSIYLGVIRKIDADNEVDVRATSAFVRTEFSLAADRLADLADEMADNVLADQIRSFAGPERARINGAL
jgi:hypothetical protein